MSVPDTPRLGFIGAGRLARCVSQRFARAGFPVVAIASRTPASARSPRASTAAAVDTPQQVADAADLIFLTVPDDHLASAAAALHFDASRARSKPSFTAAARRRSPCSIRRNGKARPPAASIRSTCSAAPTPTSPASTAARSRSKPTARCTRRCCDLLPHSAAIRCRFRPAAGCSITQPRTTRRASRGAGGSGRAGRGLGFDETPRCAHCCRCWPARSRPPATRPRTLSGPVSRGDTGIVERQLALLETRGGDHATLYALLTRRAIALAAQRATPPASLPALAEAVETSLARTAVHPPRRKTRRDNVSADAPPSGVGGRTLLTKKDANDVRRDRPFSAQYRLHAVRRRADPARLDAGRPRATATPSRRPCCRRPTGSCCRCAA